MPLPLQPNPSPRLPSWTGRHAISPDDKSSNTNDDAVHATERNEGDAADLSKTGPSGESQGRSEGLGQRSNSVLEARRKGDNHAEMNDEQQPVDEMDTVDSPTLSSTWSYAASTANTSPMLSSPRSKTPEDRSVSPSGTLHEPPATHGEPFADLPYHLVSPHHEVQQQNSSVPHLSCALARRNAYLRQSALRAESALHHPPPLHTIIPSLTKHDAIAYHDDGGYTIYRHGNWKPNATSAWIEDVVWRVQVKMGIRDGEGWEGMEREMARRRRRQWKGTGALRGRMGWGDRCLFGVAWVVLKVGGAEVFGE